MDVLIVERDELLGTVLAEALAEDGISAAAVPDEEALALAPDQAPLVVITGMNRGHNEDLAGIKLARCMRRKWPTLCIIYLASVLSRLAPYRAAGSTGSAFLGCRWMGGSLLWIA
jgi:DNA-binding response OmpR family regulator